MRLMREKAPEISGYMDRHELVDGAITGEEGFAHVRAAYEEFFKDYSDLGGYPILFGTDAGDVLCAKCAMDTFILEKTDVSADIYSEGPTLQCDCCGKEIESAYGDPDEEEE